MKIRAIPIIAKDLKPGDLFSAQGPEYWDNFATYGIGQKCYIRTEVPAKAAADHGEVVYLLEIER